jgi:acetylornithine deacetylase/succinyl-diaminopimelate desuccinylase-like protein
MLRNEVGFFGIWQLADGDWEMDMMLHLLPSADPEAAVRELLPPWMTAGVDLAIRPAPPPAAISPADHPAMRAIAAELRRDYPRALTGPFFLPRTATDSRFLRPRGIPTYGFSPFLIFTPDTVHVGHRNERIAVPGLLQGTNLYRRVVARLAMEGEGSQE